jgi:hypothetical protein
MKFINFNKENKLLTVFGSGLGKKLINLVIFSKVVLNNFNISYFTKFRY